MGWRWLGAWQVGSNCGGISGLPSGPTSMFSGAQNSPRPAAPVVGIHAAVPEYGDADRALFVQNAVVAEARDQEPVFVTGVFSRGDELAGRKPALLSEVVVRFVTPVRGAKEGDADIQAIVYERHSRRIGGGNERILGRAVATPAIAFDWVPHPCEK